MSRGQLLILLWVLGVIQVCWAKLDSCHRPDLLDPRLDDLFGASIRAQDEERIQNLMSPLPEDPIALKDRFFSALSQPLQRPCTLSKRFGGKWLPSCGHFDGEKFVCLDQIQDDIRRGQCLIYSFGIADDWSFEDMMGSLGCQVRAFDPTIDSPRQRSENVSFAKLGLGHFSGTTQVYDSGKANEVTLVPVVTLEDAMASFGDEERDISYLKVDVEGSELKALPKWIENKVINQVKQLGIEFHMGPLHIYGQVDQNGKVENDPSPVYRDILESVQKMYNMGFRLISHSPNSCVGKSTDPDRRYHNYFDVVFYKP